jgi:uncharacterized membrane protein
MKILKGLLFFILGLIALVLILGLFVKKDYKVTKEIVINKPAATVYDYVSKLKNQNNYGVWFKQDTAMKIAYTGTDGTVGFSSEWESKKMGNGKQTITKLTPNESVETNMVFKSFIDFKSDAQMSTAKVTDSTTKVTWTMSGKNPYPFNVMSLFMSMDDAVGKDYTEGLANLKKVLEGQ